MHINAKKVNSAFSRLPKTKFITSFDLYDAFRQICLDEDAKEKTAFKALGRTLYQFARMLFRLLSVPQTTCRKGIELFRLTDSIKYLFTSFTNVSEAFDEHLQLLSEKVSYMRKGNLTLTLTLTLEESKCL